MHKAYFVIKSGLIIGRKVLVTVTSSKVVHSVRDADSDFCYFHDGTWSTYHNIQTVDVDTSLTESL